MNAALFWITLGTALGCGLIAGIFFAFSNFVMGALARISSSAGVAAMQSINIVVLNPLFLAVFLGTGVASLFLLGYALLHWSHPAAAWWLSSGSLYLFGNIFVTMACNVPRNDALAKLAPESPATAEAWRRYLREWTTWNHVRTITALAACTLLIIALLRLPGFAA